MVRMPMLVKISVVLFLAAEAFILAAIGAPALLLAAAWALAALGVGLVARLVRSPTARVVLAALLVAACLVMTALEGLFFLPAAVCLLAAAIAELRHGRAVQAAGGHS
jgi:hypothetical protein